jgi:hypothetical protein
MNNKSLENKASDNNVLPAKILICVTFFYIANRLQYLHLISNHFRELGKTVFVVIVTNINEPDQRQRIQMAIANKGFAFEIVSPTLMGHPYLLAWSHLDVIRTYWQDQSITHFLYLEDDISIKKENVLYWIKGREMLKPLNLIPSFLRYENKYGDENLYSTDITKPINPFRIARVNVSTSYAYMNLSNPYQGMYFLDRELMTEHLHGPASNPDFVGCKWNIREKAAQGVTFLNVPKGFNSRNLIGYKISEQRIDEHCLIHHTPDNYANNPDTDFGKLPIIQLLSRAYYIRKSIFRLGPPPINL